MQDDKINNIFEASSESVCYSDQAEEADNMLFSNYFNYGKPDIEAVVNDIIRQNEEALGVCPVPNDVDNPSGLFLQFNMDPEQDIKIEPIVRHHSVVKRRPMVQNPKVLHISRGSGMAPFVKRTNHPIGPQPNVKHKKVAIDPDADYFDGEAMRNLFRVDDSSYTVLGRKLGNWNSKRKILNTEFLSEEGQGRLSSAYYDAFDTPGEVIPHTPMPMIHQIALRVPQHYMNPVVAACRYEIDDEVDTTRQHFLCAQYRAQVTKLVHESHINQTLFVLFPSPRDVDAAVRAKRSKVLFLLGPLFDNKDAGRRAAIYSRARELKMLNQVILCETYDVMLTYILRGARGSQVWLCNVYRVFEYSVGTVINQIINYTSTIHSQPTPLPHQVMWFGHMLEEKFGAHGDSGYYFEGDDGLVRTIPHLGAPHSDWYTHERPFRDVPDLKATVLDHPFGTFVHFGYPVKAISSAWRLASTNFTPSGVYVPLSAEMLNVRVNQNSTIHNIYAQLEAERDKYTYRWMFGTKQFQLVHHKYISLVGETFDKTKHYVAVRLMQNLNSLAKDKDVIERARSITYGSFFVDPIGSVMKFITSRSNELLAVLTAAVAIKLATGKLTSAAILPQYPLISAVLEESFRSLLRMLEFVFGEYITSTYIEYGLLLVRTLVPAAVEWFTLGSFTVAQHIVFTLVGEHNAPLAYVLHLLYNLLVTAGYPYLAVFALIGAVVWLVKKRGITLETVGNMYRATRDFITHLGNKSIWDTYMDCSEIKLCDFTTRAELDKNLLKSSFSEPQEEIPILKLYNVPMRINKPISAVPDQITAIVTRLANPQYNNKKGVNSILLMRSLMPITFEFEYNDSTVQEHLDFACRNVSARRKAQYRHSCQLHGEMVNSLNEIKDLVSAERFRIGIVKNDEIFPYAESSRKQFKPRIVISGHCGLNVMYARFFHALHEKLKERAIEINFGYGMTGKLYFCAGISDLKLSQHATKMYGEEGIHILVGGDDSLVTHVLVDSFGCLTRNNLEMDATAFDATCGPKFLKFTAAVYKAFNRSFDETFYLKEQMKPVSIRTMADGNVYRLVVNKPCTSSGFPDTSLGNSIKMGGAIVDAIESIANRLQEDPQLLSTLPDVITERCGLVMKKLKFTKNITECSFLRGHFVDHNGLTWTPGLGRFMKFSKFLGKHEQIAAEHNIPQNCVRDYMRYAILEGIRPFSYPETVANALDRALVDGPKLKREVIDSVRKQVLSLEYGVDTIGNRGESFPDDLSIRRYGNIFNNLNWDALRNPEEQFCDEKTFQEIMVIDYS